jgi:hypothetical protein
MTKTSATGDSNSAAPTLAQKHMKPATTTSRLSCSVSQVSTRSMVLHHLSAPGVYKGAIAAKLNAGVNAQTLLMQPSVSMSRRIRLADATKYRPRPANGSRRR